MNRVAWQATIHSVTKSWTQLKRVSTHVHHVLYTLNKPIIKYLQNIPSVYSHLHLNPFLATC